MVKLDANTGLYFTVNLYLRSCAIGTAKQVTRRLKPHGLMDRDARSTSGPSVVPLSVHPVIGPLCTRGQH